MEPSLNSVNAESFTDLGEVRDGLVLGLADGSHGLKGLHIDHIGSRLPDMFDMFSCSAAAVPRGSK